MTGLMPDGTTAMSRQGAPVYRGLGVGGFGRSTVLDALNQGDYSQAADNFMNHNRAGGVPNEHLTHRREQERALFLTPA